MTYGLTRLLRTEDDWSNLLCFLSELDPEPLRAALLLAPGRGTVWREASMNAGRGARAGRADFIVLLDDIESRVMEVKLGAGAHGDQFAAYDAWAEVKGIPISARYLVGPNADPIPNEPSHWTDRWLCRCRCDTNITLTLASIRGGRIRCGTCSRHAAR